MPTRRAFIGAVGIGLWAGAATAAEQRLLTKAEAHYQDQPKDIRRCATCLLFVSPDACKALIGKVSPDGWCDLYEFID